MIWRHGYTLSREGVLGKSTINYPGVSTKEVQKDNSTEKESTESLDKLLEGYLEEVNG